jgi:hypothetical protein
MIMRLPTPALPWELLPPSRDPLSGNGDAIGVALVGDFDFG